MSQKKYTTIQSLQTGLQLLELIIKQKKPLKFIEIQQLTEMTKSNLYKYLTTFTQLEYLNKDPITHTYSIGHKLIEVGTIVQNNTSIIEIANPYMAAFTKQTGLTALIALPTHEGPFIKKIWSVTYGINIGAQQGTILPLVSSTGLITAAFGQPSEINEWIQNNIVASEKKLLLAELTKAKKQGYISKSEPLVQHISSCSIPILNSEGILIAAITVVGYKNIINESQQEIVERLQQVAKKLANLF